MRPSFMGQPVLLPNLLLDGENNLNTNLRQSEIEGILCISKQTDAIFITLLYKNAKLSGNHCKIIKLIEKEPNIAWDKNNIWKNTFVK